jgi:luciferase family oxidoreductase group 1
VKLSVIDQSPVPAGFTPADALRNTIELARLADRLGYERYWIAEHHAIAALASPAPEILIARVAAETSHIRVGSGGVMLPHYSPFKVAETFRVLHALYPNRIDLGIGRAPGGTPLDTYALRRDRTAHQADDFPQQMLELMAWLNHGFPANHPFSHINVSPEIPGGPDLWLLGSSMWSASAAAQLGLPYAFAHFIDQQPTRAALEHYRSHFTPAHSGLQPYAIVAPGVICADSEEEAELLLMSARLFRRRIRQGDLRPIPTVEEAIRELGSTLQPPEPSPRAAGEWPRYFAGTPEKIRDQLTLMADELRVSELMIVTIVHDHKARMHSYELLAEAFELQPRSPDRGEIQASDRGDGYRNA